MSAYRNYDHLNELLDIYSKNFKCYVHIDKKSSFADAYHIDILNSKKNVFVISEYEIKWGSYLHLMALSRLLGIALKDDENIRFHLISDTDFPIKPFSEFEAFFEGNNNNYIEVTDITNMPVMQKRYQIYHLQHIFDRKSSNKLIVTTDKIIRHLQYALHVNRKTRYSYKGLVWGSITREAAKVCQSYLSESRINNLKYCENSEEFWLSNALLESNLKDTVVKNNLRYAVWDEQNVNGPRLLNSKDLKGIEKSGAFFARKIVSNEDNLYKILEKKIV